jgi:hypothetical protein
MAVDQGQRAPTIDELRGMSDEELTRRHDALAAQPGGGASGEKMYYHNELRMRLLELQIQDVLQRLYWMLLGMGVLLLAIVVVLIVAA